MTGERFRHKSWISCRLQFKDWKRTINTPGCYTELFFADEATAMAAGHRPCAECRREDYDRFKQAWRVAHGIPDHARLLASEIDAQLHAARLDEQRQQRTFGSTISELPDGVFVTIEGQGMGALLLWEGELHPWGHAGYGAPRHVDLEAYVTVLTPEPLVRMISAGYVPAVRLTEHARRQATAYQALHALQ